MHLLPQPPPTSQAAEEEQDASEGNDDGPVLKKIRVSVLEAISQGRFTGFELVRRLYLFGNALGARQKWAQWGDQNDHPLTDEVNERLLKLFRETCDSQMEALLNSVIAHAKTLRAKEQKQKAKAQLQAKKQQSRGLRERSKLTRCS